MPYWNPAVIAITGYQKVISPRKGFVCAHRIANGGLSCSEYTKQEILEHGLIAAVDPVRQRFAACKVAAIQLNTRSDKQNRKQKRPASRKECLPDSDCTFGCLDAGGVAGDACSCNPFS